MESLLLTNHPVHIFGKMIKIFFQILRPSQKFHPRRNRAKRKVTKIFQFVLLKLGFLVSDWTNQNPKIKISSRFMSLHLSPLFSHSCPPSGHRPPVNVRGPSLFLSSYDSWPVWLIHESWIMSHYGGNNPLEGEKCNLRLNQIQIYSWINFKVQFSSVFGGQSKSVISNFGRSDWSKTCIFDIMTIRLIK